MSIGRIFKFTQKYLKYLYNTSMSAFHLDKDWRFSAINDQQMTLNEFPEEKGYYMYWIDFFVECKILSE